MTDDIRDLSTEVDASTFEEIDEAKDRIKDLLAELSNSAGVPYTPPPSSPLMIRSREDADAPPQ